ncbi:MAG TPA: efflux RND transporter periplasmic adaptor subunit [Candidatus Binataceae bacterium]|nr:efflux RND transporter periplasmic adaptor subunit [Candidatus Binataceae bacterium]
MSFASWKTGRWLLLALVIVVGIAYYMHRGSGGAKYVTEAAAKGDIVQAVTATGTVNPVVTVQVGTYVSGPITQMLCDFNTKVKKGQLCAKIDPSTYQMTLDQAQANLANGNAQQRKDEATLEYAKVTYERDLKLIREQVVSRDTVDSQKATFDAAAAQVGVDKAAIMQQQAAVNAAKINLNYTDIISPVDGTVVSRNVDLGQTVAASFQTPTLFLIAQDLTKMQVDTNVSESDVGPVKLGQKAGFTVDAFADRTFWGTVAQVRQSPITVQNVVTYDVVIAVSNPELLLMPGMTANARIVTAERDDVLKIPLQAIRFSPEGTAEEHQHHHNGAKPEGSNRNAHVWVSDGGKLRKVKIVRGLDDGSVVEVVSGDLQAGDQVVIDQSNPGAGAGKRSSGPGGPGAGASMGMPRHL